MQVSVEQTSELSRKMTVSIPESVVQEKMAQRLKSLAREVKVHGFRPGKVPQNVVQKMYGDKVRDDIVGDLIQSSYQEAIQQQGLYPAGYPHVELVDNSDGLSYAASFEVYPEIKLQGLNELAVERPVATVDDEDVNNIIEKLREQKKTWQVVERAAEEGDQITVHFSGVSEGENFTNGKVENYPVEIGSKKMIPGFEDQLIGLSAGESKTFDISFPEEYGSEKLAGKTAQFDIEVVKVEVSQLPEIDETFIKEYGMEEGSMDDFRADVQENLSRELSHVLRAKLKDAVMTALYEKYPVTVPNILIDEEIQRLMQPYIETAKRQKIKLEDMELPREQFEEQAKRRVTLGLLLASILQDSNVQLDDAKVRSAIEDMAKSYESPEAVINWYYADEKRLHDVRQMVLEDQVVEWLVEQAKVTDKTVTFADMMAQQQA